VRIPLLEDDPLVSAGLVDVLKELGYEIAGTAATLPDAIALVSEGEFDCAIVDRYLLGGIPADDAMRLLRERRVPFLLTSGFGASDLDEEFGDAPYLQKPYGFARLRAAVEKLRPHIE